MKATKMTHSIERSKKAFEAKRLRHLQTPVIKIDTGLNRIYTDVKRNALCPCNSGKKFKSCCHTNQRKDVKPQGNPEPSNPE